MKADVRTTFNRKLLRLCPHIRVNLQIDKGQANPEYMDDLRIRCMVCKKTHMVTLLIN